ncbi:hypothetical protein AX279_17690 [Pseudomonas sp. J237]|nr:MULTISPECIES: hypothetical protein [Pseudomonas]OEO24501.1 hypothetical protein AX279_17690 [Pseudomonas sp. J237]CRN68821.1 hypothetical protein PAERUG_P40_Scotland_4_VIM_2_09_12_04167 [Pseudomonas aeruginosa]
MLSISTMQVDWNAIEDVTEHFYGHADGDVLVTQKAPGEPGPGGDGSVYAMVWTGKALRAANDLEMYRFRKAIRAQQAQPLCVSHIHVAEKAT